MRRLLISSALLALTALVRADAPVPSDVPTTVKVNSILETRSVELLDYQTVAGQPVPPARKLIIHLLFSESSINGGAEHGPVQIEIARDDTGRTLAPIPGSRERMPIGVGVHPGPLDFTATLEPPARKAKKLAQLKGHVWIRGGGRWASLEFPKLKSVLGQPLQDPALKSAGLEVTIDVAEPGQNNQLLVRCSGNIAALRSFDIQGSYLQIPQIGADGRMMLGLPRAVDNNMALALEVAVNQSVVDVPFDLRDIPLP